MEPVNKQPIVRTDAAAAAAFVSAVEPRADVAKAVVAYATMLPDGRITSGCLQAAETVNVRTAVRLSAALVYMATTYAAGATASVPEKDKQAALAEYLESFEDTERSIEAQRHGPTWRIGEFDIVLRHKVIG